MQDHEVSHMSILKKAGLPRWTRNLQIQHDRKLTWGQVRHYLEIYQWSWRNLLPYQILRSRETNGSLGIYRAYST